ncbi:hypothetical protein [Mycobacterium neglectum]|jgi:hypothetical protein|uniref:hypothetical protein n=1 Tax=Mycobacterium neglectum TaxID=242737 RepID=UPI000BFEF906|nr:hypothetical protein [Mycobacterium neglectum]
MNVKKSLVTVICAGALVGGALGIGAGVANGDPKWPGPPGPPWPPVPGPGVNVGVPGNPLPPGQRGLPPPGHRVIVPVWAPPAPPPPYWAPWLPVEWNSELNAWGVHWDGGFRTAPF